MFPLTLSPTLFLLTTRVLRVVVSGQLIRIKKVKTIVSKIIVFILITSKQKRWYVRYPFS